MVCDHNHTTSLVRGFLCEFCNSFLGQLESRRRKGLLLKRRLLKWYNLYIQIIEVYLLQDKGILYQDRKGVENRELV